MYTFSFVLSSLFATSFLAANVQAQASQTSSGQSQQVSFYSNATVSKNISADQLSGVTNYFTQGKLLPLETFYQGGGSNWNTTLIGGGYDLTKKIEVEQGNNSAVYNVINGGYAINSSLITIGTGAYSNQAQVNATGVQASLNLALNVQTGETVILLTSSLDLDCQPMAPGVNDTSKTLMRCSSTNHVASSKSSS